MNHVAQGRREPIEKPGTVDKAEPEGQRMTARAHIQTKSL
jgi:hypothetical protein